ncbi:MAG: SDR family NAD-dependent epimerase/dehydratase, partial [Flavobacteriaceae bacterium]
TRSFCYIDDTIDGLLKLLHSNYNRPMNIGNPNEFSIKKLAQLIKQIIDSDSKIVYKEIPIDDPKLRKPDISLANEIIGWEPVIDLNEGLLKTINYFRKL